MKMLCRYLILMIWYRFLMMRSHRLFQQRLLICRSKLAMILNFREKSGILTASMRTEEESCSHEIPAMSSCHKRDWKRSCLRLLNLPIIMQVLRIWNRWIQLLKKNRLKLKFLMMHRCSLRMPLPMQGLDL